MTWFIMTNEEKVLQILEFLSDKELVFKKHLSYKAKIGRILHREAGESTIRVRLIHGDENSNWYIDIDIYAMTIDWIWLMEDTSKWDLLYNGISIKKMLKEGIESITLYDMISHD